MVYNWLENNIDTLWEVPAIRKAYNKYQIRDKQEVMEMLKSGDKHE